jgi:hypothetical protein
MKSDDSGERVNFESGEQPSVLTGDLCAFFGGCEKCPGFTEAGKVRPGDPNPDARAFCTHWCHQVPRGITDL